MTESLSHYNQPEQPEIISVPLKITIGVSTAMGIFYGATAGSIWGEKVGIEVGAGLAIYSGGVGRGVESSNRAIEFARGGRRIRAYLTALQSTLEFTIGLAGGGAIAGFGIAGPEGATWGAVIGGLISVVGPGLVNIDGLSAAFRQRNAVI